MFGLVVLGFSALPGCPETTVVAPPVVADSDYSVALRSSPSMVVPDQPAVLTIEVTLASGAAEAGAVVTGVLSLDGVPRDDVLAFADQGNGTYQSGQVTLAAGTWTLEGTIVGTLGSRAMSAELVVACGSGGPLGAACCASDVCDSGACVYGQCASGPGGPAAACFEGAECASMVCTAGACVTPTCDDGFTNGDEPDVDCGGSCGPCAIDAVCGADTDCASNSCKEFVCSPTVAALGGGTHNLADAKLDTLAVGLDGLSTPLDLEFEPGTFHLWVVNQATDSVTVIFWASTDDRNTQTYWGPGASHFCRKPSSLAFGEAGSMATIHETDEFTQGPPPNGTPADFMGPTLHSTDLSFFNAGTASHLDMLHNSPLGTGIAWEEGNTYWVFDGYHSALTRYDFRIDHGPAGTDHSDGIIRRYAEGEVKRVAGVPSHMEHDAATKQLYVADTGNSRIVVLDTTSGAKSGSLPPQKNYDGVAEMSMMTGATLSTLVDGAAFGLERPSGLALYGDLVLVSDNASSTIYAFHKDTGDLVDYLDLGLPAGSVAGLTVKDDVIYFTDPVGQRVMRVQARF